MTLQGAFGRTVLPLGTWSRAANVPGGRATRHLEWAAGEPGVEVGQ